MQVTGGSHRATRNAKLRIVVAKHTITSQYSIVNNNTIMNTLFRNTLQRTATQAAKRYATTSQGPSFVPKMYKYSAKEAFFSDPSTYPLIFVLGCAMTFMTGMGMNALLHYKDLRITPAAKKEIIPTWGHEKSGSGIGDGIRKANPIAFYNKEFRSIHGEGLGRKED